MRSIFLITLLIFQFFGCVKSGQHNFDVNVNEISDKNIQKLTISDAGGPEYPPYILLKINENFATKYLYDDNIILKDSIIIDVDNFKKNYLFLLKEIPTDFLNGSGGDYSSPVDNSGLLFEVTFSDGSKNKWGTFIDDFQYKNDVRLYVEKVRTTLSIQ